MIKFESSCCCGGKDCTALSVLPLQFSTDDGRICDYCISIVSDDLLSILSRACNHLVIEMLLLLQRVEVSHGRSSGFPAP